MLAAVILQGTKRFPAVTLPVVRLEVDRVERAIDVLVTLIMHLAASANKCHGACHH